jgi:hypothetical protein
MGDSTRWDGFRLRPGDIVVSTPAKCGTTWMQMICALLVFQKPDLPEDLSTLSPWLDMRTRPVEEVLADLDGQTHRRFIKTHTPLDGIPYDESVTYICVGRDPRDVALSRLHHQANHNFAALQDALDDVARLEGGEPAERHPDHASTTLIEQFWAWVDQPTPPTESASTLWRTLHHLQTFWAVRDRPNIVLLHYADLRADLEGQMRALAARLGIDVAEEDWPVLVEAATLESMRQHADQLTPHAAQGFFLDNQRFFRRGTTGEWREMLDAQDLDRYHRRVAELAPPDLATWVHHAESS